MTGSGPGWTGPQVAPDLDEVPVDPHHPPSGIDPARAETGELDTGVAGASARREADRRTAKREARIEERWGTGLIGRIAKALSDEPQRTRAWGDGAVGEERDAQQLEQRLGDRAVLLNDRKMPGTRGNVDHVAVAASGVWIIDAKRCTGKVEKRDRGRWFTADLRLHVGGRDQTKLVDKMQWQFDAVSVALEDDDVPVHRALTFVDAEWQLFFAKPLPSLSGERTRLDP